MRLTTPLDWFLYIACYFLLGCFVCLIYDRWCERRNREPDIRTCLLISFLAAVLLNFLIDLFLRIIGAPV